MKPVEIEILMHDGVTPAMVSARKAVEELRSQASRTAKTVDGLGSSFDVSSAEAKIGALRTAIYDTQNTIQGLTDKISKGLSDATRAMSDGDTARFNALTAEVSDMTNRVAELTSQVNDYREALGAVQASAGLPVDVPQQQAVRYFESREDYEEAEALRQKIAELQAQISGFRGSDAELEGLRNALSETRDRLHECNAGAEEAALRLGSELGTQAAEASTRLYELTEAVDNQKATVQELSTAVAEASAELDRLKASGADVDTIGQARANYDGLRESLANATSALNSLSMEQAGASAEMDGVNREITVHDSMVAKLLGGYDNFKNVIGFLPGPIQNVITSMAGMTGAAKAFIATPVGAIIAAIVLALQALRTWFDSSAEGQMAFAKISGYVGGVLNQLKEIVIAAGKAIYDAFSNPKQAVQDLWNAIKTNIVNRVTAVGGIFRELGAIIKSTFDGDFDAVGTHFRNLTDQALQAATGIENLTGKVGDYASAVHEAAMANSELAAREEQLARDRSKWSIEEQRMQNELMALRNKAASGTQTERVAAKQRAQEIVDAIVSQKKRFAEEELAIVKERNSLTTNAQADYDAEYEAERALLAVEGEREQMMMRFERMGATATRSLESLAEQRKKALTDIGQMEEALEISNMEARTGLIADQAERDAQIRITAKESELKKLRDIEIKFRETNAKAGVTTNGDGLTDKQAKMLEEARALANTQFQAAEDQAAIEEVNAMRDYLKEYGSYQQQKLAIAEEYAEKIRKASNEGERLSLTGERDSAMAEVETRAIQSRIDWKGLLGGFGSMLEDELRSTLADLNAYTLSDEFKASPIDDKKQIFELIDQLQSELGGNGLSQSLQDVGRATADYNQALLLQKEAEEKARQAVNAYYEARNKTARLGIDGSTIYDEKDPQVVAARNAMLDAVKTETEARNSASGAMDRLKSSAQTTSDSLKGIVTGLQNLGNGSMSGILSGSEAISKAFGGPGIAESIGKAIGGVFAGPLGGTLVETAFSILDILKDGIENLFSSLIDTVLGAVDGLLSSILSLRIVTSIGDSLRNGIGSILNTITFGGFGSWINSSNAKEVRETTERLTRSNDRLVSSIESLKDEIARSGGWRAIGAANEARDNQESIIAQTMAILMTQMGYHGAHHSNAYYWDLDRSDYASLNATLAEFARKFGEEMVQVGSLEDIYKLTPEQMDYIRTYNISMWEKMLDQGMYDKSEYWEQYADLAGRLDEITDSLKETLTQTSFDSLRDSFVSSLLDMDKSAEGFADDFREYMTKAILNARIADLLDSELESFYDKWAEYAESGNEMTSDELAALESMWSGLTDRGLELRDQIAAITGYKGESETGTTQTGKAGAYTALSQEQGTKLEGLFTSIQLHTVSIDENVEIVADRMSNATEYLRKIEENTASSARATQEIKTQLDQIIRDGLKV